MQKRQAARRRARRRAGSFVLVLVLLGGVGAVLSLRGSGGPAPRVATVHHRTQQTLLLQLRGADGSAVTSTLLAHDPATRTGAGVLLPPEVLETIPGSGSVTIATALRTVTPQDARNAVSDLLGITVDGHWVLDLLSFGRLVDRLGGVQATVDVPVLAGQTVVLQPGAQRLDGTHAVALATYLAAGEQEQSRLARVQQVLKGVLGALPAEAGQLATIVGTLGPGAAADVTPQAIAALLTGLRGDDQGQQLEFDLLPVIPIDLGTGVQSFRIDAPGTRALVDRLLAASIPPGARQTGNRVLVLNGVGTPGLGARARARLVPAGFVYVGSRNAQHFGYPQTLVLVHDATTADQAIGARVCAALHVPVNVATADLGNVADVVVILGDDFPG